MGVRTINTDTYKVLLARSGNECAFPNCNHPIFNDNDLLIGQLCHIEAVSPGGQRFNPDQSPQERNSPSNLIFLCYRHHKESDDVNFYSVQKLKEIKHEHESRFKERPFDIKPIMIEQIQKEMSKYWTEVLDANSQDEFDLRMEVDIDASFLNLLEEINTSINTLESLLQEIAADEDKLNDRTIAFLKSIGYDTAKYEAVEYYENPLINRFWEYHNLAWPNWINKLRLRIKQAELKYLEIFILQNPTDLQMIHKLEAAKIEFKEMASTFGYVD